MRFLIDANLPRATYGALISLGHEAIDVRDIGLRSATDETIALYAVENGCAILTRDRGFGNTRRYPPGKYLGIIILSLPFEANVDEIIALVQDFARRDDLDNLAHAKTIYVHKDRIRVRSG